METIYTLPGRTSVEHSRQSLLDSTTLKGLGTTALLSEKSARLVLGSNRYLKMSFVGEQDSKQLKDMLDYRMRFTDMLVRERQISPEKAQEGIMNIFDMNPKKWY